MIRKMVILIAFISALLASVPVLLADQSSQEADASITFERHIRPILKAQCFHCHGEGEKLKGGVDLRLVRLMLTNSESGIVLVPGKPSESVLFQMISQGKMPKGEKLLTSEQVSMVERWIGQGARTIRPEPAEVPAFHITEEEREFWSFQPVRRLPPPTVKHEELVRTAIDAFLLDELEAQGLSFAPPADKRTIIRRVTYDLTGLPPTPDEVATFLSDDSTDAYEKLVDRLLASPRYGERWARHWLDVAGYADSNGGADTDSDRPWAWRYRDYVIRSFNADKPFDQFITEQLAGDELVKPPFGDLVGEELDKLIGTGFLRMAPDPTGDNPADANLARNQVIADTIQIVSSSLLGLTVQCAQCHNHRYDPIPQTDYYRLRAVFEPAFNWKEWKSPAQRQVSLMAREDREAADCIEHAAGTVDKEAQRLHDELIEKFVQKQVTLVPEDMRERVIGARRTPADKRTEEHKQLLRDYPTFQDNILLGEIDKEGAKRVEEVRKQAADFRTAKPVDPMVHCLTEEAGKNVETVRFHRGDPQQPKEKIPPGGLTVLASLFSQEIPSTNSQCRTTGRRLAFAKMLTNGTHPLAARVFVNRVWHHYFGAGIAPSLGDFGALGERPSHPELLDWLASEFVAQRWSVKSLHRLILTSTAYGQGSVHPASQNADPDNRLLGRIRLKRRDAEGLRDGMLAVTGRLNTNMYGKPLPVAVNAQGQVVVGSQAKDANGDPTGANAIDGDEFRRSVYVQVRRSAPVGVMETFDAAAISPNCEIRAVSTVPPQSLVMMNDQFVLERSQDLATRLRRERSGDARGQVMLLWRLLFACEPDNAELQRSLVYLAEQTEAIRSTVDPGGEKKKDAKAPAVDVPLQALASLCQTLLGSNRFLYLD